MRREASGSVAAARRGNRRFDEQPADSLPGTGFGQSVGRHGSTLLLAKIRQKEPRIGIVTTTYFHDDWRDSFDDWKMPIRRRRHLVRSIA